MYFIPRNVSIKRWLKDAFDYYIRYKLRCFIQMDSYSIIVKVHLDDMKLLDRWKVDTGLHLERVYPEKRDELYKLVYPWRRKQFDKYFKNGSICLVGKLGDDIVSYAWNSVGKVDAHVHSEFGFDIDIDPKDTWGIDIVVHTDYRGKGYEFAAFRHGQRYWKEFGLEHIYGSVSIRDRGSLKMHHRVGFKPVFLHHHKRILGFKKSFVMPINEESIAIANKAAKDKNISFLWK